MNVPQKSSRSHRARHAFAQPRFLLGAAALTLAGATFAAFAAPETTSASAPVPMPHTASTNSSKNYSLADLPSLVARYGESRRLSATPAATGSRTTRNVGTGESGFNLVETDLTPNSPSDEREPVVSPNGELIAFTSTGADTNGDGKIDSLNTERKYHIWIMNQDGSGQRQLTGFGVAAGRNQSRPTWSPDGNDIAFSDEDNDPNGDNPGGSQLWTIAALTPNATPVQRTFFRRVGGTPAIVQSPAWGSLSIAFVTNYDGRTNTLLPSRDIFTIAPVGLTTSLRRITGDPSSDPIGNNPNDQVADADDDHPAWSTVNNNVLFYSSNRDATGIIPSGRRIWRILADGTKANPVTDPTKRPFGQASDVDDYPAASLEAGVSKERVAFQTNTYLDASDQANGAAGRDLNIWTLPVSSNSYTPGEPRTYVGSYDNDQVIGVNTQTQQVSGIVPSIDEFIPDVEGVVVSPDGRFVFVADRSNGRVLRYREADGAPLGSEDYANSSLPASDAQFTPNTILKPVGLAIRDNFLYVTAGYMNVNPTPAVYRFDLNTGEPAPATSGDTTGLFSGGETGEGVITNGAEGIAITNDAAGKYMAVAALDDDSINLYDRATGLYLSNVGGDNGTFVRPSDNGLTFPTGITWGPDLNGDGNEDLYVCSSATDAVKVYAGPNLSATNAFAPVGPNNTTRVGSFIANIVADLNNGGPGTTGLNAPEYIRIADLFNSTNGSFGADGTPEVYVTSFRTKGTGGSDFPAGGYQVNRYQLDVANDKALPWPATQTSPSPTQTVDAAWISLPPNPNNPNSAVLSGAASFDFNQATLRGAAGTTEPIVADETTATAPFPRSNAIVLTNILSSQTNFNASRLRAPQGTDGVDRSADREPSFARDTATAQSISRLAFASNRKFAPNTGSNGSTTASNPFGGDGEAGTHDIWFTSTQDTTPPALLPQGAGNELSPVVAPQSNAPFFAPRTVEDGLKAGLTPTTAELAELTSATPSSANTYARRGGLRFAVVLRDVESGLRATTTTAPADAPPSVTVSFYDAASPQFQQFTSKVNDGIFVTTAVEGKASIVNINGASSFTLNVYDDGPSANGAGGHEQQAGAVAGDGNFYCEGLLPTPTTTSDFYIDVTATDRTGNSLTYDNVWGFSTTRFGGQFNSTRDLLVSDYTAGQLFPFTVGNDVRLSNMPPVESYYLSNPGGYTVNTQGAVTGSSLPSTFTNVDIWRTLCRGAVTQDVLNLYRPRPVAQIDPNNPNPAPLPTATPLPGATATPTPTAGPTPVPTATPIPFSQLTRNVTVAQRCVIWAAPYAGTAFVGPGTIVDPTTQANLTSFLSDGGRLFISGREIARSLSSAGSATNTFLNSELGAQFSGEASNTGVTGTGDSFLTEEANPGFTAPYEGKFADLQFPINNISSQNPADNSYADGAFTQNNAAAIGDATGSSKLNSFFDILTPQTTGGATLKTDYTGGNSGVGGSSGVVGQRIVRDNRNNGLQSRVVFFSFGFEAINRRYTTEQPRYPRFLNTRAKLASLILQFFKTNSVSGKVTRGDTGRPVANFLVRVDGIDKTDGTFFARTDVNGLYSLTGLPGGDYRVQAYTDSTGLTSPQGFTGETPVEFEVVGGGTPAINKDLVVTPPARGAVIGRAVSSNGTPDNGTVASRADDVPVPNLSVLIRSQEVSSVFPNGGQFAALTTTNATGDFSFSGVFAKAKMDVIFNPNVEDIPATSNLRASYQSNVFGGPNPNFGRRILPDAKRPLNDIIVPPGDNFFLNDTGKVVINGTNFTVDDSTNPDTAANQGVPILVPRGKSINGVVRLNGTATAGATVTLSGNGLTTTPSSGPTDATGTFSFSDLPAGTYTLTTRLVTGDLNLQRDTPVTLSATQDAAATVNFTLATLNGKVVQNSGGAAVANATVTLQNSAGSAFVPARTATTNASGDYSITRVPGGDYTYNTTSNVFVYNSATGSRTYTVAARQGSATGSTTVAVNATDTVVNVTTIRIASQDLSGLVLWEVDNYGTAVRPEATVQLFNATDTNFTTPLRTTTTGADGTYSFANVQAGTYRVRARYEGDTVASGSFNYTPGALRLGNLLIRLRIVYGTVYDTSRPNSSGSYERVNGATVRLYKTTAAARGGAPEGGTVVANALTGADGSFQFSPVATTGSGVGSVFYVTATKSPLTATTETFVLARAKVPPTQVFLYTKTSAVPGQVSFPVLRRTYAISMPYQTSANAGARNAYERTSADATIPVATAFNYPQLGTNSANQTVRYYTISRFNPITLAYEAIPVNGRLIRGEGYLLRVEAKPESGEDLRLKVPANDATLVGLPRSATQFTINLAFNSSSSNGLNGRNLIGFGLNPTFYGSVDWDNASANVDPNQAKVQVQFNGAKYTIKQAVAEGIIAPSISTIDPETGSTVTATTVSAYRGYFVTARRAGVKLLFQFPTSSN